MSKKNKNELLKQTKEDLRGRLKFLVKTPGCSTFDVPLEDRNNMFLFKDKAIVETEYVNTYYLPNEINKDLNSIFEKFEIPKKILLV